MLHAQEGGRKTGLERSFKRLERGIVDPYAEMVPGTEIADDIHRHICERHSGAFGCQRRHRRATKAGRASLDQRNRSFVPFCDRR